jgi:hypothetical protein
MFVGLLPLVHPVSVASSATASQGRQPMLVSNIDHLLS